MENEKTKIEITLSTGKVVYGDNFDELFSNACELAEYSSIRELAGKDPIFQAAWNAVREKLAKEVDSALLDRALSNVFNQVDELTLTLASLTRENVSETLREKLLSLNKGIAELIKGKGTPRKVEGEQRQTLDLSGYTPTIEGVKPLNEYPSVQDGYLEYLSYSSPAAIRAAGLEYNPAAPVVGARVEVVPNVGVAVNCNTNTKTKLSHLLKLGLIKKA
jgi:hypothetical protein